MPRSVATILFALFILWLIKLDRDQESRVSPALWIPVLWFSIGGSRMISLWFGGIGGTTPSSVSAQLEEGSLVDRLIFTGLLLAGLSVLATRGRQTVRVLHTNWIILLFFLYGAVSVLWSDYSFVAFKRLNKAVGNIVMVFLILTEADSAAAIKRLLAQTSFLLIPTSILLIKYYLEYGRSYDPYTGIPTYVGVNTSKNGLAMISLIFGIGALWRVLRALETTDRYYKKRQLIVHGSILGMALWLLYMTSSAAAIGCALIGSGLIWLTGLRRHAIKLQTLHIVVVGILCICVYGIIIDTNVGLVQAVGRDANLTDRTSLWADLIKVDINPWLGAGFESFWLGSRIEELGEKYWWQPNQAHNGYLELYLNLGWIGIVLQSLIIFWGYRNISRSLRQGEELARLKLTLFVVALIFNLTEATFKVASPMWIVFLLAISIVPMREYYERRHENSKDALLVRNSGPIVPDGVKSLQPQGKAKAFHG